MKHYNIQKDPQVYFSTCTIEQWQCLFKEEKNFRLVVDSLNYCIENKRLTVIGYVIMLNHLHLITINSEGTTLSNIMRDFKRHTAAEIAKELEIDHAKLFLYIFRKVAKGKKKEQAYKIWRDESHPKAIYTQDFFLQKLQYMHINPVRKSLVSKPEHWRYCSARTWLYGEENDVRINMDRLFED
jgi:putative transposase